MIGLVVIIAIVLISFIATIVYDKNEMDKMHNNAKKEENNKKRVRDK